jgi:hypothetical protein
MNLPVTLRVCRADYTDPVHAAALVSVLDAYAQDPMGGGEALSDFAKANLVAALAARPQAYSVLAFAQTQGDALQRPVGLVNCIEGFSTFACQPLVNGTGRENAGLGGDHCAGARGLQDDPGSVARQCQRRKTLPTCGFRQLPVGPHHGTGSFHAEMAN